MSHDLTTSWHNAAKAARDAATEVLRRGAESTARDYNRLAEQYEAEASRLEKELEEHGTEESV